MIINILGVLGIGYALQYFHDTMIVDALTVVLVSLGLFFFLGTTVGLIRFPDFYTRMHAAGKGDTFSSILILAGCTFYTLGHGHMDLALAFVGIKILLIVNFIFIGSPTATHAIMDAGYETGVKHWSKKDKS
jgi:multicomponent Na+:H+ antiporter subunit G